MRKSEAHIHNATFRFHKWTEMSLGSLGHRSKWDIDKYKHIVPPQAEQPFAIREGNQKTLLSILVDGTTEILTSFYHPLVRQVLGEHYELWELLKEGKEDYTSILFYDKPGMTRVLLKITVSHFFLNGLLFSCCRRKQKPTTF